MRGPPRSTVDGKACAFPASTMQGLRLLARRWAAAFRSKKQRTPRRPVAHFAEWQGCFGWSENGTDRQPCTGRGTCVLGLCACVDGAYGADCAEGSPSPAVARAGRASGSLAERAPLGRLRRTGPPSDLQVYVYDLPAEIGLVPRAAMAERLTARGAGDAIYSAEWRFVDRLLGDRATRTLDPAAADLFYVPVFAVDGPACNNRCDHGALELALQYVRARYGRWWSRRGGRDHVAFLAGDRGACGLGALGRRLIILSHWGLVAPFEFAAQHARLGRNRSFAARHFERPHLRNEMGAGRWCHSPHKDIVVPPFVLDTAAAAAAAAASDPERAFEYEMIHAGGIFSWLERGPRVLSGYSLGMRQALFEAYGGARGGRHRILVANRSIAERTWHRAKSCLAPAGDGWGIRVGKSVLSNCVPLVAQPFVLQPFEDVLSYERFALRLSLDQVDELPRILGRVNGSKLAAMRRELQRVRAAFVWGEGGKAYEYTLLAMCHRAVELLGSLRGGAQGCARLAGPLHGASATRRSPSWLPQTVVSASRSLVAQRRERLDRRTRRGRGEVGDELGPIRRRRARRQRVDPSASRPSRSRSAQGVRRVVRRPHRHPDDESKVLS